jgi:uncharacterized delta-60 repeat protein
MLASRRIRLLLEAALPVVRRLLHPSQSEPALPSQPHGLEHLEARQMLAATIVVPGTSGDDAWLLRMHADAENYPDVVQLFANASGTGTPLYQLPRSQIASMTVNGDAGNDTLIVDLLHRRPFTDGDLTFNGNAGTDTLRFIGRDTSGIYMPGAATTGSGTFNVTFKDVLFTGTETLDATDFASVRLATQNVADEITVTSPAAGTTSIAGTSGSVAFTPLTVSDTPRLVLDTGAAETTTGDDSISISATGLAGTDVFRLKTGFGNNSLTVTGGTLPLYASAAENGLGFVRATVKNGAIANLIRTQYLAELHVKDTARVNLTPNAYKLLLTDLLDVGATAKLDLADNDMIVHGGDVTHVTSWIQSGYAGRTWTGYGIISSTAHSTTQPNNETTLGIASVNTTANATHYTDFADRGVNTTDVIVKYTYAGDANLDGGVNGDDYFRIDSGFISNLTGWYNGDFNYSGLVNADDYFLIDSGFNTSPGAKPAFTITGNATVNEGSLYTLNLSSTYSEPQYDPEWGWWTALDNIQSWTVYWGDETTSTYTGHLATATHAYADDGSYSVKVVANGRDLAYVANTRTVTVNNVAPSLTYSGSGSTALGGTYTLTLNASDPGDDELIITVDWGDGVVEKFDGDTTSTSHTYTASGVLPSDVLVSVREASALPTAPTATLDISTVSDAGQPNQVVARFVYAQDPDDAVVDLRYSFSTSGLETSYSRSSPASSKALAVDTAPTIHARIVDPDNQYTQYTLMAASLLWVGSSSDTDVTLSYTAEPGRQLQLEMAGPGDLNYRIVTDFTPEYEPGTHESPVSGLQADTHYRFRLKVVHGETVYYASTTATTTASTPPTLNAPDDLQQGTVSVNLMPVSFKWVTTAGFTVKAVTYSDDLPYALFNTGSSAQEFTLPHDPDDHYSVPVLAPPYVNRVQLQITQGSSVSPWVTVPLSGQAPPPGPNLTLTTSTASNGAVTFTVGATFDGKLYWINNNNQLIINTEVPFNGNSSLTVQAAEIPPEARRAVAFLRDDASAIPALKYSDVVAVPGTVGVAPAAPADLTATASVGAGNQHRVRLAWTNAPDNEAGYVVQRQDVSQAVQQWVDVATTAADQTFFTDTPPSIVGVYEYRVRSAYAGATSASQLPASNVVLAWFAPMVSAVGVYPQAPVQSETMTLSVTASASHGHPLSYAWDARNPSGIWTPAGSAATATLTPDIAGEWKARLTVTDLITNLSTVVESRTFTVAAGTALRVSGPAVVAEGATVTFAASGASASSPTAWTVTRNGSAFATGTGLSFTFTTGASGSYVVQASDGVTASASLNVFHAAPAVTISGPPVGFTGEAMTFAAHVDAGPIVGGTLQYAWTLLDALGSPYPSGGAHTSALSTFRLPGTLAAGSYEAKLVVTEVRDGVTNVATKSFGFRVLAAPQAGADDFDWGIVSLLPWQSTLHKAWNDYAQAMARQADGKILLAGGTIGWPTGQDHPAFITRFNTDLTLDRTFGPEGLGTVTIDFGGTRLVPGGSIEVGDKFVITLAHAGVSASLTYTATGTTVASVVTGIANLIDAQTTAPWTGVTATDHGSYVRLTAATAGGHVVVLLDSTETDDGPADAQTFVTAEPDVSAIYAMALDGAGDIVVVGALSRIDMSGAQTQTPLIDDSRLAVARYLPSGVPDPSFNGGQPRILDSMNTVSAAYAVTILGDGSILVGGAAATWGSGGPVEDFLLVKLTSAGALDTSFNGTGIAQQAVVTGQSAPAPFGSTGAIIDDWPSGWNGMRGIQTLQVVQHGGVSKIIAGGSAQQIRTRQVEGGGQETYFDVGFSLVRYNANGTIDTTFGPAATGKVFTTSGAFNLGQSGQADDEGLALLRSIRVTATEIVAVGVAASDWEQSQSSNTVYVALARYDANGIPISNARNVALETRLRAIVQGTLIEERRSVTVAFTFRSDGQILVALSDPDSGEELSGWELVSLSPGSVMLDTTFDGDGRLPVPSAVPLAAGKNPTSFHPMSALLLDGEDVIMAGELVQSLCDSTSLVTRYRTAPEPAVTGLTATAENGAVTLTWTNVGFGHDGYEIRRATTQAGLDSIGSIIGHAAPDQHDYIDPVVLTGTAYYRVVPLATGGAAVAATATLQTPAGNQTVRKIVSPAASVEGVPSLVAGDTPVKIVSASPGGAATPWYLWVVPESGQPTLLASSNASAGTLPSTPAVVATLHPALFADGTYTLRLTASADPGETGAYAQKIYLSSAVKAGNFSLPITDATFNTPAGPMPITRLYNSVHADRAGLFGHGWTFGLLDAQLRVTTRTGLYQPASYEALRAGDLVYLTVPTGGQHVFQFAPAPVTETQKYNNGFTGLQFVPRFVALDGSGATLTTQADMGRYLAYDQEHQEYVFGYSTWSSQASYNPTRPNGPTDFYLTTKEGVSYTINGATGVINRVANAAGNGFKFHYDSDTNSGGQTVGTITAKACPCEEGQTPGETLLTIKTLWGSQTGNVERVTSIEVPEKDPIRYEYDTAGSLVWVQNESGDRFGYAYQSPGQPHLLTGLTSPHGAAVLQAQYDGTTGRLQALVTAAGQTILTAATAMGANQVTETVADAAGNVMQVVYDVRYGTPLRSIRAVRDAAGNVTHYAVTIRQYDYVAADLTKPSALHATALPVLRSVREYAPFDVIGPDAAGVRFSYQPGDGAWVRKTVFDTGITPDAAWKRVRSVSERLTAEGTLRTTLYDDYVVLDQGREIAGPQLITVEIRTPNPAAPTGYDRYVQSMAFTKYNANGNVLHELLATNPDTGGPGVYAAQGTTTVYYALLGRPETKWNAIASVTVTAARTVDWDVSEPTTLGVALEDNTYYNMGQGEPAGNVYGGLWHTTSAAGEKTYYAYDRHGRVVLLYTLKKVPDPANNGQLRDAWVGTINTYNSRGLLVDTYEGSHWDNQDGQFDLDVLAGGPPEIDAYLGGHFARTLDGGYVGVHVAEGGSFGPFVRTAHNVYNSKKQLISVTDQYGGVTTNTYDGQGRVIRVVYPDKTEVRTVYDEMGREVWKTDRFLPAFPGDAAHAGNKAVVTNTIYNSLGQVVETRRYQGAAITITSVKQGSVYVPQSTVANEAQLAAAGAFSTTKTWYDEQGRVIETLDPSGLRTGTIYYPDGRARYTGALTAAAPDGGRVTTTNGISTRAYLLTDFLHHTESQYDQYDATLGLFHDLAIDANSHGTRTYKDALGRQVRTVFDDDAFTETIYSYGNAPITRADVPTTDEDWTWGTSATAGGSVVIRVAQHKETDPAAASTYYLYDASGRLIDVWLPAVDDARTTSTALVRPHYTYVYDTAGNQILEVTPNQQAAWFAHGGNAYTFTGGTRFLYDQHGRQLSRTLPAIEDGPDPGTDPDVHTETWTYDPFGRVATHVDFEGQSTGYVYDDTPQHGGLLLEEERFAGAVDATPDEETVYTHDGLGRTRTVTEYAQLDADAELEVSRAATTYTYDPIDGQVTLVHSPEGYLYHAYDPATGLLTDTWTGNADRSKATTHTIYGYDDYGRLASVTSARLNNGNLADPGTNRFNAVGSAVLAEGPTTLYTYDSVGNLDTVTLPNGVVEDYAYDALNRLDLLTVSKTLGGNKLFEQDYVLENDGQRDYVIERRYDGSSATPYSKVKIDWTYDAQDRLIAETRDADTTPGDANNDFGSRDTVLGDYTDTFAYDLGNNRIKKIRGWDADGDGIIESPSETMDQTTDYAYNARDQLLTETTGSNTTTYGYDQKGSTTSETAGGQTTKYVWDLRNRMVGVDANGDGDLGDTGDTTYVYDADGVRVRRAIVGGTSTQYLNDDLNPTGYSKAIEERDNGSTSPSRSFVLGHDPIAQVKPAETLYFMKDGRGTTRALLESSGTVKAGQTFDFDAFSTLLGSVTPETEWLAADGRRDAETGFTYSLARYRDAWRFVSADDPRYGKSSDPVSLHKYLYAHANPISGWDPSGNVTLIETEAVAGARANHDANQAAIGAGAMGQAQAVAQGVTNTSRLTEFVAKSIQEGRLFEKFALRIFDLARNTDSIVSKGIRTIPDVYNWGKSMWEFKRVAFIALTSQLRAQIAHAVSEGIRYTLVIAQGSQVSKPLKDAIKAAGGVIYELAADGTYKIL